MGNAWRFGPVHQRVLAGGDRVCAKSVRGGAGRRGQFHLSVLRSTPLHGRRQVPLGDGLAIVHHDDRRVREVHQRGGVLAVRGAPRGLLSHGRVDGRRHVQPSRRHPLAVLHRRRLPSPSARHAVRSAVHRPWSRMPVWAGRLLWRWLLLAHAVRPVPGRACPALQSRRREHHCARRVCRGVWDGTERSGLLPWWTRGNHVW
mmetsp:Transcript_4457/g.11328  ORF Transcript_4457/g.11328 Transcript_4457/m.11328 type:complete len:202 (+) Transcript_4457:155-760(+)